MILPSPSNSHAWLSKHVAPQVTEPVRLHMPAKRYLCAVEPDYFAKLSPDSVRSLALQGGPMSPEAVAAFRALPHHAAALQLPRFDEGAKVKGLKTPEVAHFMPYVEGCVLAKRWLGSRTMAACNIQGKPSR